MRTSGAIAVAVMSVVIGALTTANLVDEFKISLVPVVLGDGERLFRDGTAQASLTLVGSR